ncbi:unnamed protein product [Didymodactylos carnosus]|uniref:Uncharacterized protein n=1 Tax=Didymodactylos carnosus TaxID=1234261 RepID=A0A8S2NR45_9BILA|nr:unnamed protein product [Didymodactylos carnosus]CAF4014050.1 unnamed protein product [Didymodactylos carnosus]
MFPQEPAIRLFHDKDHNLENFTVVWLDADINKTDDCHSTKKRLRPIANHLTTFCDVDECIDYISSIKVEQIAENAKVLSKDMMPMNVFNLSHNEKSIRGLDKESAVFMWNQLLMDVLLPMPKSDESKTEMLTQYESYCRDNDKELENLHDFDLNYSSDAAVLWHA